MHLHFLFEVKKGRSIHYLRQRTCLLDNKMADQEVNTLTFYHLRYFKVPITIILALWSVSLISKVRKEFVVVWGFPFKIR